MVQTLFTIAAVLSLFLLLLMVTRTILRIVWGNEAKRRAMAEYRDHRDEEGEDDNASR